MTDIQLELFKGRINNYEKLNLLRPSVKSGPKLKQHLAAFNLEVSLNLN